MTGIYFFLVLLFCSRKAFEFISSFFYSPTHLLKFSDRWVNCLFIQIFFFFFLLFAITTSFSVLLYTSPFRFLLSVLLSPICCYLFVLRGQTSLAFSCFFSTFYVFLVQFLSDTIISYPIQTCLLHNFFQLFHLCCRHFTIILCVHPGFVFVQQS